eukprot:2640774-Rhodomonas_salina.1
MWAGLALCTCPAVQPPSKTPRSHASFPRMRLTVTAKSRPNSRGDLALFLLEREVAGSRLEKGLLFPVASSRDRGISQQVYSSTVDVDFARDRPLRGAFATAKVADAVATTVPEEASVSVIAHTSWRG